MIANKKGGEKYLSIWWFFVLIVIAAGIVVAVIAFNGADVNIKELEADILITRVVDCVVDNGYINEEFLKPGFDIFQNCYLNKELIIYQGEGKNRGDYYLAYEVYELDKCNNDDFRLGKTTNLECENPINPEPRSFGVANFVNECKLSKVMKEAREYPLCSERYIYVLDKDNRKLIFHLIAGSNQKIKS